ncbi:THC0290_0291 family protein [Flavobacterium aciduliphilum]|uniref:Outer membrane protein with beta-barrel domain n=1 Tax=Flavobacterium aciduliphilum TaxID=1101402 RepID=A0A328YF25_9FLAO|nr:glutamate dehydrogenase [Flavobacterium aciduliphilum]RAR71265.1 hypothetical protein CLV55_1082 [Flavobacterium aciduliphilum]
MKTIKYFIFSFILLLGIKNTALAQYGFSHEIGAFVGPTFFQSDYGQRNNLAATTGNIGYGIGLIHYLNFSYRADCSCYTPETYFNDHFKLRTELSYTKSNFKHYGDWVDPSKTSLTAEQLRAMHGSTELTDIGMQLEFFPKSIRDFTVSVGSFAPFIALGGHFSFFKPNAYSDMGPGLGKTTTVTPDKYIGAVKINSQATWSIVTSIGTRYKLSPLSDLMLEMRFQYYFSDWVDGLRPNPEVYTENKANDWNVWLNFGYIYYIQ